MIAYDPRDPRVNADPFATFRRLREEDPVHRSAAVGGWVVTRAADVQAGLKDPRLSSDRITPAINLLTPERQAEMAALSSSLRSWTVFADPPTHTRLRGLFNKAFTPKSIEPLRARITQIIDELLAEPLRRGHIELIADFAYPLPALVICEMIGIPKEDIGDLQRWSDDVATFIGLPLKPWESFVAADRSNQAMLDYFGGLVEDHRRRPREDLLSSLIAATEGGGRLSESELVATCALLLFAAHTTTTHLISNGIHALVQNPEQLALLRAEPALIDSAIEELLRYDGPIQAVRRMALEPLDIGGRAIAKGELVFFMINAANRDPSRFESPDVLDIRRPGSRHLAFGSGIHFCPGAGLTRMEARPAFQALVSRTRSMEIEVGELAWLESFGFRGIKKLPMRLVAR